MNRYNIYSKFIEQDIFLELNNTFKGKMPVIVCLGSDRLLSDSTGVFVGEVLKKRISSPIFGNFDFPITTTELPFLLEKIRKEIPNKKVLIVDSALGKSQDYIGFCLGGGKLYSYNKKVGDAGILSYTILKENDKLKLCSSTVKSVLKKVNIIANAIVNYYAFVKKYGNSFSEIVNF